LYTSLKHRLSRIRETPGLTDKLVETDPAHAATWFLDYKNAVKEVLDLSDQGPELESTALSIPTLYIITSKLPFTMSDKIYDIEQNGKPKLEEIIKIISKARMNANARSPDLVNNTSTRITASTYVSSRSYASLDHRLSRIRETPGLTDKMVETPPHTPQSGSLSTETW
jgi:hypothetical protein